MKKNIELSENDLDVIKLALKKSINVNNRNLEKIGNSEETSTSSPQNEVMQELLNRLEVM